MWRRIVALGLLLLVGSTADAVVLYRWRFGSGSLTSTSVTCADGPDCADKVKASVQAAYYSSGYSSFVLEAPLNTWGAPTAAGQTHGVTIYFAATLTSGGVQHSSWPNDGVNSESYTPPPDACTTLASVDTEPDIFSGTTVAAGCGAAMTGAPNGCHYTPVSGGPQVLMGGVRIWSATNDGYACPSANPLKTQNSNCVVKGGVQSCITQSGGKNCGTVNGDLVCVDTIPAGSCQTYASGGVACSSVATTPPAPDSGTAGTPATPTASITQSSVTTNYYSSTVVNNSTTGGTGEGGAPTGVNNPTASGSSSSGSSGSGDSCTPGSECAGDLPEIGGDGDCEFSECLSSFMDRVQDSPLVSAVSGVSAAFPSGSCPSWNLSAFDHSYSLSAPMCSIWEDISPFLSGVMLLVWGWVATRIVLSA